MGSLQSTEGLVVFTPILVQLRTGARHSISGSRAHSETLWPRMTTHRLAFACCTTKMPKVKTALKGKEDDASLSSNSKQSTSHCRGVMGHMYALATG